MLLSIIIEYYHSKQTIFRLPFSSDSKTKVEMM